MNLGESDTYITQYFFNILFLQTEFFFVFYLRHRTLTVLHREIELCTIKPGIVIAYDVCRLVLCHFGESSVCLEGKEIVFVMLLLIGRWWWEGGGGNFKKIIVVVILY